MFLPINMNQGIIQPGGESSRAQSAVEATAVFDTQDLMRGGSLSFLKFGEADPKSKADILMHIAIAEAGAEQGRDMIT